MRYLKEQLARATDKWLWVISITMLFITATPLSNNIIILFKFKFSYDVYASG